ncbi:hypothetical protein, partial [Halomonas koreensis]
FFLLRSYDFRLFFEQSLFNNVNHADKVPFERKDMRYVSSVSGNCRDVIADQTPWGYMVKR